MALVKDPNLAFGSGNLNSQLLGEPGIQHIVEICRVRVEVQKELLRPGKSFYGVSHVYLACEHCLGQHFEPIRLGSVLSVGGCRIVL